MATVGNMLVPLVVGAVVGLLAIIVVRRQNNNKPPLPPGPKGLPLLGNLHDLPKPGELEYMHWLSFKEKYGGISSVTVLGSTIVIINDARLAFEMMEKRSAKYSSRPKQIFAGELVGWEDSLGFSPYNDRFRTYRKNMAKIIGSKPAAAQFNPLQEEEVGHFLLHVLESPNQLIDHIKKEAGAVILKIGYGYNAEPHKKDTLVDMAGDAMDKFAKSAVPGAFMVDMLPFLRSLPDWIPGQGWKQIAKQWNAELYDVIEKPYAFVKEEMARDSQHASFLSKLIDSGDAKGEERFTNKLSAMSLYTAGADTTVSSLACFFLAMMIYPEVQKKAQAEIDQVIGTKRLPKIEDRANLPYIEAIVLEVLRWHPVAPMALPHCTTEDDTIEGYYIPKGSMVFANVWHFTHDPAVYSEPEKFKPERYFATKGREPEPDPHMFSFGFGRRVCPGRILADNALFLNIAQSLAVFSIDKATDASGNVIEPAVNFLPGVVSHPAPYETSIKPRSPEHEHLIRSLERIYPWRESDWERVEASYNARQ